MWVACRWVKPECKCSHLEIRPDLEARPACATGLLAVFILGQWGFPFSGEARLTSEIGGTGGYGVSLVQAWRLAPRGWLSVDAGVPKG